MYQTHRTFLPNISKPTLICRSLCIHTHIQLFLFSSPDYYFGKQCVDTNWTSQRKWDNNIYVLITNFDYVFHNSKIVKDKLEVSDWHDRHTGINKW